LFIPFYVSSYLGQRDLSYLLWEKIRPLNPLPPAYRKRFTNAQAIVGLMGLDKLDEFNKRSRDNAAQLTRGLSEVRSIRTPKVLPNVSSTFYQYCIRASDSQQLSRLAIRRGIDIEIMHVDICNVLPLFSESARGCPHAEGTAHTLQLPVYASLEREKIDRILRVIIEASQQLPPVEAAAPPASIASFGSR
jgi:dTDP-4-amino-4,6-dideoxygalactose transaminase